MDRALCPVETLYVGQRSRGVASCTLSGHVDATALSAAFDSVTQEHPPLRSRIVPDGEGFALRLLEDAERPRLTTRTGAPDKAYPVELNAPLPVGGPLSRSVLVSAPEGDRHLFTLSVDHTIGDGHSIIAAHNEVWNRYRAIVEDGAPPGDVDRRTPLRWAEPVSRLLPPADPAETDRYREERIRQVRRQPVDLLSYDVADPGAVEGRIAVARLALDQKHTTLIRDAARRAGVSVQALISAALLVTARRHLPGDEARTLGCLSPVDLRSRLSPPIPALNMVPAVTTHLQTVDVTPDTDPMTLARAVHGRVSGFVHGPGPFHEMRMTPEIPRSPALQLATVIVTNMGVVPGPRLPAGLTATDVRLVPAREHYFPQAGRSPVMACVVSFEGRLAIEFPHYTACFSERFVQRLRDEVRAALLAFTDTAEPVPAR